MAGDHKSRASQATKQQHHKLHAEKAQNLEPPIGLLIYLLIKPAPQLGEGKCEKRREKGAEGETKTR